MSSSGGGACHHCGCAEIDVDASRGNAVCTGCGAVLDQHIIVSEVQFEENAHGGTSAIGQFVGADGKGGRCDSGFNRFSGRESREVTLNNARRKLNWLGQKLRLNQHCVDTSFNFFKMALSGGLTRGRKNDVVTGACLYITCRTEGTPHMLIDFSDALLVDVSELGRTYTALTTALCINIPVMDPCMYVMRFANKLEFGAKTHEVSVTAARLMQRMKRDWIHTGRRPSGLCGAALLLAARVHGFNRSVDEVVGIVRVHHSTVRKRLTEFKNTPSSSLTLDEFMSVDLDQEVDPPAFINSRTKDKEQISKLFSNETQAHAEFQALQREIDRELEDCKHKLRFKWHQDEPGETEDADAIIKQLTMDAVKECAGTDMAGVQVPASSLTTSSGEEQGASQEQHQQQPGEDAGCPLPDTITPRRAEVGLGVSCAMLGMRDNAFPSASHTATGATNSANKSETDKHKHTQGRRNDKCAETTPGGDTVVANETDDQHELSLEGIDDSEIDSYIMSSKEILFKSKLWLKLNADYLKEQQEKRRLAEQERIRQEKEGRPVRKTRRRRKQMQPPASGFHSAEEAIERMLHEKKLSSKINYEVLRELSECKTDTNDQHTDTDAQDRKRIKLNMNEAGSSTSTCSGGDSSLDQSNPSQFAEPAPFSPVAANSRRSVRNSGRLTAKRSASSMSHTSPSVSDTAASEPTRDTEQKTPVLGANDAGAPESDEDFADDYEEELDEEDAGMMSAAQLLNKHSCDEFGAAVDEDYY